MTPIPPLQLPGPLRALATALIPYLESGLNRCGAKRLSSRASSRGGDSQKETALPPVNKPRAKAVSFDKIVAGTACCPLPLRFSAPFLLVMFLCVRRAFWWLALHHKTGLHVSMGESNSPTAPILTPSAKTDTNRDSARRI